MSKITDITEKLSFDENPVLKIKDQELEVQSDAETMLLIMGLFSNEKNEMEAAVKAAELIFSDEDRQKIKNMKLQIGDYMILIQEAMNLAMGATDNPGER